MFRCLMFVTPSMIVALAFAVMLTVALAQIAAAVVDTIKMMQQVQSDYPHLKSIDIIELGLKWTKAGFAMRHGCRRRCHDPLCELMLSDVPVSESHLCHVEGCDDDRASGSVV